MKYINIFFILLFLFCAMLQINDPDPFFWISLYMSGAIICYLALKGKVTTIWYYTGLIIYISYAVFLFFAPNGVLIWIQEHHAESIVQSMKVQKPWIEVAREFFGLLILAFALLLNLFMGRKYSERKR